MGKRRNFDCDSMTDEELDKKVEELLNEVACRSAWRAPDITCCDPSYSYKIPTEVKEYLDYMDDTLSTAKAVDVRTNWHVHKIEHWKGEA